MAKNDEVLLAQILRERAAERATAMADDDAFEIFAAEQALHEAELTEDEILAGIVDGSNDGGIDGIYTFLNGQYVPDDSELLDDDVPSARIPRNSTLELVLLQAKTTGSFSETAVDKVRSSLEQLLDLEASADDLAILFNGAVLTQIEIFRQLLIKSASRRADVRVKFIYATPGDVDEVNTKVTARSKLLVQSVQKLLSKATADVEFLGAAELWGRATRSASYALTLVFEEQLGQGGSHVALVRLGDYYWFVVDEDGDLRRHIFDFNVRDWEGSVEVNKEIISSLLSSDGPDTWWLNNGVTIVCRQATSVGNTYHLEDVQIVNGLQTSFSIYEAFKNVPDEDERLNRHLLVRILATEDVGFRDQIIRATNRQTRVPDASLRATDPVQRQIESYFADGGLYYDRRRNFHRNMGKPTSKILSITYLAQAVLSIGLADPHQARARPSTLMKDDTSYERIFSASTDLEVYLWIAKLQRQVDAYLLAKAGDAQERTNLRFLLSMMVAANAVGTVVRSPTQLRALATAKVVPSDAELALALSDLRRIVKEERKKRPELSFDQLVKGPAARDRILRLRKYSKKK